MRSYTYHLRSLLRPIKFALSLALLPSAPTLLGMEGSGMMIASRNGMVVSGGGGAWTNPYVTDGLIAMWDGEWNAGGGVHDAAATTWKDIAGAANTGANDLIIASDNTWGEKCLNKINLTQSSAYNSTPMTGVKTFEFVIGIDRPSSTSWAYPLTLGAPVNDAENRIIQLWARGVNTIQGRLGQDGFSLPEMTNTVPTMLAVQFTYGSDNLANLCMVNGTQRAPVAQREQAGGNSGGVNLVYNASYQNTQRYYTIRVYNRALTAAEIAANYAIDKTRFNLP